MIYIYYMWLLIYSADQGYGKYAMGKLNLIAAIGRFSLRDAYVQVCECVSV